MKWLTEYPDVGRTRVRFRLFIMPTTVGEYTYWLHPSQVRERWTAGYGGSGWDIVEVLEDTLSIPI